MTLRFIGKDPASPKNGSPTVWVDDENDDIVIQSWAADRETREECARQASIPDHETVIRLPSRMLPYVEEIISERKRTGGAGS